MLSKRILIVDDSPLICNLMEEAVRGHSDYGCQSVFSAEQALEVIQSYDPHLLVIDVGLPGMNGYDLLIRLKEDRRWESVPVILITSKNESHDMVRAYNSGADDLILKPFDPVDLVLKIKSIFRRMSFTIRDATTALEKKTIRALGKSVEMKDISTEGHSARVAFYSVIIGKALFLSEAQISLIEDAGYLHDLGKIGISEKILNKTGALTPEEWEIMKTHPEKSAHIIEALGFLTDMVPLVKHHHEKYDGSGYPNMLAGEGIPLGSRIISVADAFDAMTSVRSFRKCGTIGFAIAELKQNSGSQFDPMIADIFMSEIRKFPGIETLQTYSSSESFELLKLVKG